MELAPLTDELKMVFGDKKFEMEEELHDFINQKGIADFPVILVDGNLYLRRPTDQHNRFTSRTIFKFASRHGRFGYVTGTHNVHLSSTNGFRHREPDVSFFGAPRCVADAEGDLGPYDDGAVPDVVIQFSWRNKRGYEEDAIDEMMNDAVEIERGPRSMACPRVGYLIKVRFKKKQTLGNASKLRDMGGLDLYRLPHGTTVDDAINGAHGASMVTYVPGGPDQCIDINAQDLGFTGASTVAWNGFQIRMSHLFDEMDSYNKKRQQNGLAC